MCLLLGIINADVRNSLHGFAVLQADGMKCCWNISADVYALDTHDSLETSTMVACKTFCL